MNQKKAFLLQNAFLPNQKTIKNKKKPKPEQPIEWLLCKLALDQSSYQ